LGSEGQISLDTRVQPPIDSYRFRWYCTFVGHSDVFIFIFYFNNFIIFFMVLIIINLNFKYEKET
jgi:hypothetical protein